MRWEILFYSCSVATSTSGEKILSVALQVFDCIKKKNLFSPNDLDIKKKNSALIYASTFVWGREKKF